MNFWASKLNSGQPTPPVPQRYQTPISPAQQPQQGSNAWWMAQQAPTGPSVETYVPGRDGPAIEELARMDPFTLSQEALELIASYKLKTNQKYENTCPHCNAANGLMKATRSTAPRCVECGYSERGVHEQLQPLSKIRPGKDTIHARDFTGGSMGGDGGFQHQSQSPYLSEYAGPGR